MPSFNQPQTLVPQNVTAGVYGGQGIALALTVTQNGVINSIETFDLTSFVKSLITVNDPTQGLMFANGQVLQANGHPLKRY